MAGRSIDEFHRKLLLKKMVLDDVGFISLNLHSKTYIDDFRLLESFRLQFYFALIGSKKCEDHPSPKW